MNKTISSAKMFKHAERPSQQNKTCKKNTRPTTAFGFRLAVIWAFGFYALPLSSQPDFVGSQTCIGCHATAHKTWQQSDHFHAMASATAQSVLGDFDNVRVHFHAIDTRFFKKNAQFFVETANASGKKQTYLITHTLGYKPLQQYLIELDNGHIQALNIAWDSRPTTEGGQRWFHLHPDAPITPEHPFFWTRYFQNWNGRCAECHTTGLQKNYAPDTLSFHTTFSEVNVACESCHGPSSAHIKNTALPPPHNPAQACAQCHALRLPLTPPQQTPPSFHQDFALQLPSSPHYFPDGQIREEVFVMGSFLQSKMSEQGVTCQHCHDPHSGKPLFDDNRLCTQCHSANTFDSPKHHHHPPKSSGAACVNCHMPTRTYMQVDDRRDHSFVIPNPFLSEKLGTPNACTQCHDNQSTQWAMQAMQSWNAPDSPPPHDFYGAMLKAQLDSGQATESTLASLKSQLQAPNIPALRKAGHLKALGQLPLSPQTASQRLSLISPFLHHPNPLLQRGAIQALRAFPISTRWRALEPLLSDKSKPKKPSMLMAIGRHHTDLFPHLSPSEQATFSMALDAYRTHLAQTLDSPGTQLSLADVHMHLGQPQKAKAALERALTIEPHFLPALLNLADWYRLAGQDPLAGNMLKKATAVAPNSGAAHYSYALFLIRQKQYHAAISPLTTATQQADATAEFSVALAMLFNSLNQPTEHAAVLNQALTQWPQHSVLRALQAQRRSKTQAEAE